MKITLYTDWDGIQLYDEGRTFTAVSQPTDCYKLQIHVTSNQIAERYIELESDDTEIEKFELYGRGHA